MNIFSLNKSIIDFTNVLLLFKMNGQTLYLTIRSISSDSNKNTTLENIISSVTDLKWSNVISVIGCYSSNTSKVNALQTIVFNKEFNESVSAYLPQLVNLISSNSDKVNALETVKEYILATSTDTLIAVLQSISSDVNKVQAVSIIGRNKIVYSHSCCEYYF